MFDTTILLDYQLNFLSFNCQIVNVFQHYFVQYLHTRISCIDLQIFLEFSPLYSLISADFLLFLCSLVVYRVHACTRVVCT